MDDKQFCIIVAGAMLFEGNIAGYTISTMRQMISVTVLGEKWDSR